MSLPAVTLDSSAMATLLERFVPEDARGVFLMGSRARGSAGPYSDVDWVRVAPHDERFPDDGSYLIDDRLVTVSTMRASFIDAVFSEPKMACDFIMGLRSAQILLDRAGDLARLQRRARDFVWDAEMQHKANLWATDEMVGIIEEAHKGLEGLRRDDIGRMLNARFGLSWVLSNIMKVQRGVLFASDNDIWDAVNRAVGETTLWVRLRRTAFGIEDATGRPVTLREQIIAGLRLYVLTAAAMERTMPAHARELVAATSARIEAELGNGAELGNEEHGATYP